MVRFAQLFRGRIAVTARSGAWLVALLALSLSAISCDSAAKPREHRVVQTGKPALHAVKSDQLRHIMGELNLQARESTRAQIYAGDAAADMDWDRLQAAAKALHEAADYIPGVVNELGLSPEDQRVFTRLAQKLQNEVETLQRAADRQELTRTRAAMDRIESTCTACHSNFRLTPISPAS